MLTFDATVILVHGESGRAELANRNVIFDNAGRISGTALSGARVHALVVDAGLVGRAAAVLEAGGHL